VAKILRRFELFSGPFALHLPCPDFLCLPSCPLSSRAFGPRKRMKIGFSTLWLTALVFRSPDHARCPDHPIFLAPARHFPAFVANKAFVQFAPSVILA
jgi:hypothetical protein